MTNKQQFFDCPAVVQRFFDKMKPLQSSLGQKS